MRKIIIATLPVEQSWNRSKSILHRLFTWITGYEILFEGSREDLIPDGMRKNKTEEKLIGSYIS